MDELLTKLGNINIDSTTAEKIAQMWFLKSMIDWVLAVLVILMVLIFLRGLIKVVNNYMNS